MKNHCLNSTATKIANISAQFAHHSIILIDRTLNMHIPLNFTVGANDFKKYTQK